MEEHSKMILFEISRNLSLQLLIKIYVFLGIRAHFPDADASKMNNLTIFGSCDRNTRHLGLQPEKINIVLVEAR